MRTVVLVKEAPPRIVDLRDVEAEHVPVVPLGSSAGPGRRSRAWQLGSWGRPPKGGVTTGRPTRRRDVARTSRAHCTSRARARREARPRRRVHAHVDGSLMTPVVGQGGDEDTGAHRIRGDQAGSADRRHAGVRGFPGDGLVGRVGWRDRRHHPAGIADAKQLDHLRRHPDPLHPHHRPLSGLTRTGAGTCAQQQQGACGPARRETHRVTPKRPSIWPSWRERIVVTPGRFRQRGQASPSRRADGLSEPHQSDPAPAQAGPPTPMAAAAIACRERIGLPPNGDRIRTGDVRDTADSGRNKDRQPVRGHYGRCR